jgi:hypothetical protein
VVLYKRKCVAMFDNILCNISVSSIFCEIVTYKTHKDADSTLMVFKTQARDMSLIFVLVS